MKTFRISFHVKEDKLVTLLGCITKEISALSIEELPPSPKEQRKPVIHQNAAYTQPAGQHLLSILDKGGAQSTLELSEALATYGYAISTATTTLHRLLKEGYVARDPHTQQWSRIK